MRDKGERKRKRKEMRDKGEEENEIRERELHTRHSSKSTCQ
jgi:hypothetical protein